MKAPPLPSSRRVPSKLEGRIWVLAAALLWSTGGLFAKAPIFDDCPLAIRGPMFAFWRAFFAALVLLPMVRRPRFRGLIVPLVLIFTAMNVTYLVSLTRTTAANAIWLQATAPWWVFLFSVFLFRERIVGRDLIPLAFGCLGVGAILVFEIQGQARFGVLAGLASGIGYALVLVLLHQLGRENSAWLIAVCHAVAAVAMLPWVFYLGWWPSLAQLAVLAGFGALQMGIPYTFMTYGMRAVSSQEAVAIALIEPILMPLWVFLLYHEVPAWWTVVGAALILVGLVLRYVVWEFLAAKAETVPSDG